MGTFPLSCALKRALVRHTRAYLNKYRVMGVEGERAPISIMGVDNVDRVLA